MRAFLVVLKKDLRRKIRSPLAAVVMLLFPVVFSLLIGLTFGSSGEKLAPVRIAVVDEDQGLLARLIRSSFNQQDSKQQFELQVADLPAAMRLIENDRISAVLRIPPGFTDSVLAEKPATLELVKNPAQSIYPRIAEQYVGVLAQLGDAAVRILGPPVREIRQTAMSEADGRVSDPFVSRVSLAISHRLQGVSRYALPPRIRVEKPEPAGTKKDEGSPLHVAVFVLPGMAVFALLMMALVSMQDFQREGARGTLARQFTAPVPFGAVILGKIGATCVLSLIATMILALLALLWARTAVSAAGFTLLSIAFAFAATGFAALVQSFSRTERAGSAIGSILVMIMSMAGGSFIPPDSLPAAIRRIAPFTLNYWGAEGYRSLFFASAGTADLGANLGVLFGAGALFSLLAVARFTRRYATGG